MVIGVVLPMFVYYVDAEGNTVLSGNNMAIAGVICSICAVICYLLCYNLTTERVKIEKETEKFNLVHLVKYLVSNRALIGIIVAAIMLLLSQLTLSGMGQYIYPNYFGSKEALSTANMITAVLTIILAFVLPSFVDKVGKKELAIFGGVVGSVALIAAFLVHTDNLAVWIGFYAVAYFGIAFFNVVCWAMITDVIDDAEVRTGKRSDGTIYAVYSFARKLGQAASSGLTGGLLTLIGYSKETAFDPDVVNGIYNITCIVPAAGFILLSLALAFIYPLNRKKVAQNVEYLKKKRGEL